MYDKNGGFYSTTKIYGYLKNKDVNEGYKFWLGLLNSSLFWFFIRQTGYVLRGGYYTFKTNYVHPFPIPKKIPATTVSLIEELVLKILDAKKLAADSDTTLYEETINKEVYKLYGFNEEEIMTIEKE